MFLGSCFVMIVTAALLGLSGCTPGSPASSRQKLRTVHSFEIAADYQTVYDRMVRRARQRYTFTYSPLHQPGLSADLYPDSQSATVTLWDSGRIGFRYRLSAHIRSVGPAQAQVELLAAGKSDAREAQLWALWAQTPLEDR